MTNRIALCGHAGSGKTTFAEMLAQRHAFTTLSLAGPVKVIGNTVADSLGMPPEKAARRALYQAVGMGGRTVDPMLWIRTLVERHHLSLADGDLAQDGFVIDDVRFPNEAHYLHDMCGFTIIKVDAPIAVCLARLQLRDGTATMAVFADASEQLVEEIDPDFTIPNVTEHDRTQGFLTLDTLLAHATV